MAETARTSLCKPHPLNDFLPWFTSWSLAVGFLLATRCTQLRQRQLLILWATQTLPYASFRKGDLPPPSISRIHPISPGFHPPPRQLGPMQTGRTFSSIGTGLFILSNDTLTHARHLHFYTDAAPSVGIWGLLQRKMVHNKDGLSSSREIAQQLPLHSSKSMPS